MSKSLKYSDWIIEKDSGKHGGYASMSKILNAFKCLDTASLGFKIA